MGADRVGNRRGNPHAPHLVHFQPGTGDVVVSWAAKVFCVMALVGVALSDPAYPDDAITPIVTDTEHPLPTPTEVLPKAANALCDLASEVARMSDIDQFMSDWWPVPLNNSSILTLSA